jgi:hypothetical protein
MRFPIMFPIAQQPPPPPRSCAAACMLMLMLRLKLHCNSDHPPTAAPHLRRKTRDQRMDRMRGLCHGIYASPPPPHASRSIEIKWGPFSSSCRSLLLPLSTCKYSCVTRHTPCARESLFCFPHRCDPSPAVCVSALFCRGGPSPPKPAVCEGVSFVSPSLRPKSCRVRIWRIAYLHATPFCRRGLNPAVCEGVFRLPHHYSPSPAMCVSAPFCRSPPLWPKSCRVRGSLLGGVRGTSSSDAREVD